jgi:hypothetical protein
MLSLEDFRQKLVRLAVPVEKGFDPETGEPIRATLNVVYRAHIYDRELEEELTELARSAGEAPILAAAKIAMFCRAVASWDLRRHADDPEPIPITPEALRDVPIDVIDLVMDAIRADRAPKAQTTTSS